MNGRYRVTIKNNKVEYRLPLERNFTVIRGDSGAGKTTMINMVLQFIRREGVNLIIEKYNNKHWYVDNNISVSVIDLSFSRFIDFSKIKNTILFIDEEINVFDNNKIKLELMRSGNYVVWVSRRRTQNKGIPFDYAIGSILVIDSKIKKGKKTFNNFKRLYKEIDGGRFIADKVITEDSGIGKTVVKNATGIDTVSANGKTNVTGIIERESKSSRSIYVIVDGAAFGNEASSVVGLIKRLREGNICDVRLHAPESFEWMCLKTNMIGNKKHNGIRIIDIVEETYNYIDYYKYFTWEQFYTELLKMISSDKHSKYNKKSGLPEFKTQKFLDEFREQLTDLEL